MSDEDLFEKWARHRSLDYRVHLGLPRRPTLRDNNVRNVTEGPIVSALVSVFDQLEQMGAKRHASD